MAVPRIALPNGNTGVALPQPLGPSDAVLVRRAFALQDRGDLQGADRAIADVQNDLLLGHLQAARDLGRFHRTTAAELTDWLDRYGSQPEAPAMRALLLRRLPKGASAPPLPVITPILPPGPGNPLDDPLGVGGLFGLGDPPDMGDALGAGNPLGLGGVFGADSPLSQGSFFEVGNPSDADGDLGTGNPPGAGGGSGTGNPVSASASSDANQPPAVDAASMPRQPMLERLLAARLQHGGPPSALRLIDTSRGLPPSYAALLRGEVVRALFTDNADAEALHVARQALRTTPPDRDVGLAAYLGGLAAWRLDHLTEARHLFATAADAPAASAQQRAAASFWSARAADRLHDPADAARWLQRAAAEKTTLHGLIARRLLGLPTGIVPSSALLSQADVDAIAATHAGWRAFALLQVGQPERAAQELRGLWPAVRDDPALRRALLLVAAGVGLTDCAAQLAAWSEALEPDAGGGLQFALPRLHPAGGFRVDPALVYALARVESNFDPDAVSAAGARGLMQLMPVTAQYVSSDASLGDAGLHDPAVNLELGQRYVLFLAAQQAIGGNLLRLLASYNAGLGGYLHWAPTVHDDGDPLLFIEAVPTDETRRFVERVLTYTWIYAARLHVPAPSLDDMAAGEFPSFTRASIAGKIATAPLHAYQAAGLQ